ncbi:MAG: DUF542 domain-containing protein [Verrucomicrobia bacterium]|nr:DUF542 domain-containing protein [Verrucomicrobiota bacterium]
MSHQPNVPPPEGTPFSGRTVEELVAERPGRPRVFESFQVDFCCQGRRTLSEACAGKGVSLDDVVAQLDEEDLHRHIHLEKSVLFPAAQKMALAG